MTFACLISESKKKSLVYDTLIRKLEQESIDVLILEKDTHNIPAGGKKVILYLLSCIEEVDVVCKYINDGFVPLDSLEYVSIFYDRYKMHELLQLLAQSFKNRLECIETFLSPLAQKQVIKTRQTIGTHKNHTIVVSDLNGKADLEKIFETRDLVYQPYIENNFVIKTYNYGEQTYIVAKSTLGRSPGVYKSNEACVIEDLSERSRRIIADIQSSLIAFAKFIRETCGVRLFNFDTIYDEEKNIYRVIEINHFPLSGVNIDILHKHIIDIYKAIIEKGERK